MQARSLALACLALVAAACGGSSSATADAAVGCESPTLPGAIYCHEEASGVDPTVPADVASSGGEVFLSDGMSLSHVVGLDSLSTVAQTGSELFVLPSPAGEVCWLVSGGPGDPTRVDCAAVTGGAPRTWLAQTSDGTPQSVAAIPGASDFVVAYAPAMSSGQTALARVDGAGAAQPAFAHVQGYVAGVAVLGTDAFVSTGSKVVRAPLDGSATSDVVSLASSCSLYTSGGVLYCADGATFRRIAPGAPTMPMPLATPGFLQPRGDLLVRAASDQVTEVGPDGAFRRVLWQRPSGFEGESVSVATVEGSEVIVALAHRACQTVGQGKLSMKVCDATRGRLELVRAAF